MVAIHNFLYKRIADYGKKYQSGADTVSDFNGRIAEVQSEIFTDLAPFYQTNEKVRGILETWVKVATGTAVNGMFTIVPIGFDFDRIVSIGITDISGNILYEVSPIMEGEVVSYARIPQRKPNSAKKRIYYRTRTDTSGTQITYKTSIELFPKENLPFVAYYLVYPNEAKLAFAFTQTTDEDIQTYDPINSIDLGWSSNAANLILYKMLEKYGITNREQWISEYAKMGISESMLGGTGNGN